MSRLFKVLFIQTRSYKGQRPPAQWNGEGVKYGLVTYYPRHPNHKDPPITPTKLLMVQRIKRYTGNPWWHKAALDKLRLNDKIGDIAIVKNTPEVCASLWKIKHLVHVTPINTPEKLPQEGTFGTYLHPNGDLLITPKVDEAREKATEEFINDPKRMDRPYINEWMRLKWLEGYTP